MSIFSWFAGLFSDVPVGDENGTDFSHGSIGSSIDDSFGSGLNDNAINPANGLPMVGGEGGVDVEGNPFGTDFSHNSIGSGIDDSFSSGIDDSFSGSDGW